MTSFVNRRELLRRAGGGFGAIGLASALQSSRSLADGSNAALDGVHHAAKAKRVIFLHLMGIDHTRLTFRYSGRDYRLTDVHGRVIDGWFA